MTAADGRLGHLTVRLAGDGDVGALRVLVNGAYRELAEPTSATASWERRPAAQG